MSSKRQNWMDKAVFDITGHESSQKDEARLFNEMERQAPPLASISRFSQQLNHHRLPIPIEGQPAAENFSIQDLGFWSPPLQPYSECLDPMVPLSPLTRSPSPTRGMLCPSPTTLGHLITPPRKYMVKSVRSEIVVTKPNILLVNQRARPPLLRSPSGR
jgi:hypothetical protein